MKTCPLCGQALPQRRGRICANCGQRIKRHERWHLEGSRCIHDDCKRPGASVADAQLLPSMQEALL